MRTPGHRTLIHLAALGACASLAVAAHAQDAAPAAEAQPEVSTSGSNLLSPVVVTGSRIAARGFTQPTPTTRMVAADLEKTAKPNLFNAIAELPALQGSTGRTTSTNSTSSGIQGLSSLSLRGLGPIRTLTLLDGQRVVGANVTGVTDVSQFPQLLVKQVDVVTGGASASYGSDAVGGVVNFITDTRFTGFKANVEGGQTNYGDDKNGTLQAAWGRGFLGGRAHLTASAEYSREKGVPSPRFGGAGANGRDWFKNPAFQVRPIAQTNDGKPQYISIENAQQFQYAKYGLITNGPLQGTAFGPGGVPIQFQYGSNGVPTGTGAVTGCITPFCIGGDLSGTVGGGTTLGMNMTRQVAYTRGSFELNDDHEVFFTLNYGKVDSLFTPNPGAAKNANLTIQCSNPFLPASIVAACAANNITSFQYGVANAIFPKDIEVNPVRTQMRGVVGANGKFDAFGKPWTYDAYAAHAQNTIDIRVANMTLNARYNAAIDAVRAPNGSITCRNPAAAASGCVPLNVIGDVPIDPAAWAYIAPANGPQQHSRQRQSVAAFNINGEPFSLWAGPVAVAFGAEARREQYYVIGDPYGNGVFPETPNTPQYPADPLLNTAIGNNWYAGNYHNAKGAYHVKEAFIELNLPLFKSATLGEASFNIAGRQTDYSTSGNVDSWKLGATWKTGIDGLRLRAVTSKDVRAPNLSELFAAPLVVNNTVNHQGTTLTVQQRTIGNTQLRPEIGRNTTLGIVLAQPKWAPGFSASVDYFDIKVDDVISSLTAQQEVDLCNAGNQEICAAMDLVSATKYVTLQAFNLASMRNKGFDLEGVYRFNLGGLGLPGSVTLRGLATHTRTFKTNSGVVGTIPSEAAGVNLGNTPKWKGQFSQSWENDTASLTLSQRWISDGVYSNEYIECQTTCPVSTVTRPTILNNQMKGAFYWDIGGSYKLNKNLSVYFKVDNLTDVDPVAAPQTGTGYGINPFLYDVLGRQYRVGARMQF
ncbi:MULTISPECIES: TonB-dependent receptor domain-containing protein [unclassified Roseateles]|uniref:TonB-dependent receptor domain-containing protein n=1 Tax=unclassified Roseateles TaxID=2626991 RepID=UPI0006F56B10|nr:MULTISPECIES: TonB-dependent receptor [unclassified Roseateles]KQW41152.1 TonB-dependent receptor [Pelomonas sp. Root405]KRA67924.1 TonB-dependent receptor [Pelomonas sp. Root662]